MIQKIKKGLILFVIWIVAGCATTEPLGKLFSEIVKPSASKDHALVYIYRVGQNSPITMGFVKIYLNEDLVFNVADHGFTWVTVKPGVYKFKASWAWLSRPKSIHMMYNDSVAYPFDRRDKFLSLELEAGKTYFINYSTRQGMLFTDPSERYQMLAIVASIESENEYERMGKLESCRFQENEYKP